MTRRRPVSRDQLLCYKVASVLLCYPSDAVYAQLADVSAAVGSLTIGPLREPLDRLASWLARIPRAEAERHHVAAFDLTRRSSPYLTYYRYGDTRQRGMALLALKHTYREAGFEAVTSELPDYLPVVLEFAAFTGEPGVRLLQTHRAGLELVRLALNDRASPYADALDAVSATLPSPSVKQSADVRRLAADGPPKEQVGLDPVGTAPFAPPELLGQGREPAR